MDEELYKVIAVQLQKKKTCVEEIFRLTRDMGESISRNDRVSTQLQLEMRQEEMDQVDKCNRQIKIILESLDQSAQDQIGRWLDGFEEDLPEESFAAQKILELSRAVRETLQKTMVLDRGMSKRIAGESSYYK